MASAYHVHGHNVGLLVAWGDGTTDAVANTTEPVAHGLTTVTGAAITPAHYRLLVIPFGNAEAFPLYLAASDHLTATHIDVWSGGTAIPYQWMIFHVGEAVETTP